MQDFDKLGVFYLGRLYDLANKAGLQDLLLYASKDLVTHAVCIGMTGSGKTGLCISLIEEAAIDGIPAIVIDPKGDITNLLLTFPDLEGKDFAPWINEEDAHKKGLSPAEFASQQADLWRNGLSKWGQDGKRIGRLSESADFAIYTPGSNAGLPISILKSFQAPQTEIREDSELLQESINTTVTSLLSLLGIVADPIRSREHILLSTIFSEAWQRGEDLDLGRLIQLIQSPPLTRIGVLDLESFYPSKDRFALAMQLNNLLAAPGCNLWLEGEPLNIADLLHSPEGKPKVSIFYIAHLNDTQRMFFVSLLLNQIVGWMRTRSGTTSLRSILYIDEVFGYLPPLANPPSKLPLMTLLKQARAFGLGVVLATQNPIDLDYKALSNAGTWFLGRLQTERDKQRVLEGLEGAAVSGQKNFDRRYYDRILAGLGNRVFLMNNVHKEAPVVFETRWAMSYLRGPLTRDQIKVLAEPMRKQKPTLGFSQPAISVRPPVSSITAVSSEITTVKPLTPPDVQEYFVPYNRNMQSPSELRYRPMIVGAAQVRFSNLKAKVNIVREHMFLTPITDSPLPVNWDDSEEIDLKISDLRTSPPGEFAYDNLPSSALKAKNYTDWEKDFKNWLYTKQQLELFKSVHLNEISKLGETERDFKIRLQEIAREKRDEQVEKLREKYGLTFARIDERVRKAEMKLEEQQAQVKSQKYQTAVSIGETLLGSFLGRKSSTRASKTTGALARSQKKSRDREAAETNLKALQQERSKLEAKFEAEVDKIETSTSTFAETLEKVTLTPSKSDVTVNLIALAWKL
jgi:hypothetical protein